MMVAILLIIMDRAQKEEQWTWLEVLGVGHDLHIEESKDKNLTNINNLRRGQQNRTVGR